METELKQVKQYAYLLEELCYYAVRERVNLDILFSILPKNRSITEKAQNIASALNFIINERADFNDKTQLKKLRYDYDIQEMKRN